MLANERFVAERPGRRRRGRAREARALPARARCDRRLNGVAVALAVAADGFGLERMHALLDRLGDPERALRRGPRRRHERQVDRRRARSRRCCAPRVARAPRTSRRTSRGWGERLDDGCPTASSRRVARVRADAEAVGATQFEVLTAAAFADFAARGVDVAVVEAGPRRPARRDERRSTRASSLLTNVGLEHTEVLGETREEIAAREAGGRRTTGPSSCCRTRSSRALVAGHEVQARRRRGTAAEAYLGHPIDAAGGGRASRPARARADGEVRDGAHTPEAVDWLLERLPRAARLRRRRLDPRRQGRRRDPRAARPGRAARSSRPARRTRARCPRRRSPAAAGGLRRGRGRSPEPAAALATRQGARAARPRHRLALPACRSLGNGLKSVRCRAPVTVSVSSSSPSGCSPSSSGSRSRRATR